MNLPAGLPTVQEDWERTPLSVQAVVIALWQENQVFKQHVASLQQQVNTLQAEVEKLRERVNKNSENSSKPPSSDAPRSAAIRSRKRAGGRRERSRDTLEKGGSSSRLSK